MNEKLFARKESVDCLEVELKVIAMQTNTIIQILTSENKSVCTENKPIHAKDKMAEKKRQALQEAKDLGLEVIVTNGKEEPVDYDLYKKFEVVIGGA
jgi:hypothetical protein